MQWHAEREGNSLLAPSSLFFFLLSKFPASFCLVRFVQGPDNPTARSCCILK
jgi:hypothetical protein